MRTMIFAAIAACLMLTSCTEKKMENMKIAQITGKLETHCIGRYLIDLPEGYLIAPHSQVTLTYGVSSDFEKVDIEVLEESISEKEFLSFLAYRQKEIEQKIQETLKVPMLASVRKINNDARQFRIYDESMLPEYQKIETHVLLDNTHLVLKADSYKNNYKPVEDRQERLANQLKKVREPNNGGIGYCIGSTRISSNQDQEAASLSFQSPRYPGLRFEIYMTAIQPNSSPSLIERIEGQNSLFKHFGVSPGTIKKGSTLLGGMQAEEWLGKNTEDGNIEYNFVAESARPNPGFAHPLIKLEMEYSTPGQSDSVLLTEEEAIALWNAVIKTVRPRNNSI
jgi:hypothetical protein